MARRPSCSAAATSAPKWRSMRSVWSRVGCASITVVAPAACSPASSTADLIWAEGTGVAYSIGSRSARAAQGQRQPVLAFFLHLQPHLHQRLQHPAHRPARQRGVAHQPHPHVVAGDQAHHQSNAGAGVAEIDVGAGLSEAADATAQHLPCRTDLAHRAAHRLQRLGGVEHVLALEQAARCVVRPVASAPSMRARWEIDLSPGTRTVPESARDLAAESGEEGVCDTGATLGGTGAIWAPLASMGRPPECGAMLRCHRAAGLEAVNSLEAPPCRGSLAPGAAAGVAAAAAICF